MRFPQENCTVGEWATTAGETTIKRCTPEAVADATSVVDANIRDLLVAFDGGLLAWANGLGRDAFRAATTTEEDYSHKILVDSPLELGVLDFVLSLAAIWKSVTASSARFLRCQDLPSDRASLAILIMMVPCLVMTAANQRTL